MDGGRVVPALRGDDDGQLGERVDVVRVLERAGTLGEGRGGAAGVGGGEEHGVQAREVSLVLHALHQDGTDHAPVTDETN